MQDRPGTECARGCRTTRRCRWLDHRCSPHPKHNGARKGSWWRLPPCDLLGSPAPSTRGKSIQRGVTIGLPGIEPRRRLVWTIWRVGIGLRLQAQRVILAVNSAIFSGHCPVEEIARIELDTGLICQNFEDPARLWIFHAGSKPGVAGAAAAQAEIVIVALADLNLFNGIAQAHADPMGDAEIERRPIDPARRAQWDAGRAHRQVSIRGDREVMIQNAAAASLDAGKIEEAVIGQIDDRRLVGLGRERRRKFHAAGNAVSDAGLQPAGIALLAIRAVIGQRDEGRGLLSQGGNGPALAVETCQTAVKRVGAVIGRQLKAMAIQLERTVRDAVGITTDRGAEETPNRDITFKVIAAEDDVGKVAGAVRREDGLQRCAKSNDPHLEAVVATQRHHFARDAIRQMSETLAHDFRNLRFFHPDHAHSSMKGSTSRRRPSMKASATWTSGGRSPSDTRLVISSTNRW